MLNEKTVEPRNFYPVNAYAKSLKNQTIRHQFPQIFNLEILHPVLFFNVVKLTVTAVTGNHQHPGTGSPDLVHFFLAVKNAFLVVPIDQRAAAAAAADLIRFRRIKVDPVFDTLAEDPTRLIKEPMPEPFLGFSAIIARIVIGGRTFEPCFIQFYASLFNIFYEKIKYSDKFKFFQCFRVVFFETRPGRQIGVPSFGPHQRFDLQFLHMFDNTAGHDFHGFVITGKIRPVCSLPVFGRYRPVFFSRMKNSPPVL